MEEGSDKAPQYRGQLALSMPHGFHSAKALFGQQFPIPCQARIGFSPQIWLLRSLIEKEAGY